MKICTSAFLLLALAAACGRDSVTGPGEAPADLTQVLAEMALPSVTTATTAMSGFSHPSVGAPTAGSCSYTVSSQSFVCPTVTAGGLTFSRSYTLLDASGNPLPQYDVHATDGVRTTSATSGTVTAAGTTLTVDDHGVMTLTGLLSGRHVMNGVQTSDMSGSASSTQNGSFSFTLHAVTTTSDLVMPSGAAGKYPQSGTVTMDISSTLSGFPPDAMRVQLKFNGTSKVDVTISGAGFTDHCTLDLASSAPACA